MFDEDKKNTKNKFAKDTKMFNRMTEQQILNHPMMKDFKETEMNKGNPKIEALMRVKLE